jgi:thymidylate synthase
MEQQYLQLLHDVLMNGEKRMDRTGVGTLSVFGRQIRCDLGNGFPALTTKKLFWKPVVGELLWFLEGSGDERRLAEITYDTRDESQHTIWTGNARADYWKDKAKFPGDAGRIYGVQWRRWQHLSIKHYDDYLDHWEGQGIAGTTYFGAKVTKTEVDQIARIIDTLKRNPGDRRMVLSAFNVGELDQMSLPPCHMFAQFYVKNLEKGPLKLCCQVYIRSNDLFLGLPFNIASYALLTHMMAQVTSMDVGELIITIGDAHIYNNHMDQVKEQLTRTPLPLPFLALNPDIKDIDKFTMSDIVLMNYESHPPIKAPMAV